MEGLPSALRHQQLPWYTPEKGQGIVLAGGAVASLIMPTTKPSDYDLFLIVPSAVGSGPSERHVAAQKLVDACLAAMSSSGLHEAPNRLHPYAQLTSDKTLDFVLLRCESSFGCLIPMFSIRTTHETFACTVCVAHRHVH
jgi:hypothetical protein